jgi:hypothetical protein
VRAWARIDGPWGRWWVPADPMVQGHEVDGYDAEQITVWTAEKLMTGQPFWCAPTRVDGEAPMMKVSELEIRGIEPEPALEIKIFLPGPAATVTGVVL